MSHSGDLIKAQRKAMKVRQISLAEHLGVSAAFVCRIEYGLCALPPKYIEKVCEFLDIKKADFIRKMTLDMENKLRGMAR